MSDAMRYALFCLAYFSSIGISATLAGSFVVLDLWEAIALFGFIGVMLFVVNAFAGDKPRTSREFYLL